MTESMHYHCTVFSAVCVKASRKKVYMLYGIQPDRSVTGGSWYTDQDFDSQFVDTLIMMCHRFLEQKVIISTVFLYFIRRLFGFNNQWLVLCYLD